MGFHQTGQSSFTLSRLVHSVFCDWKKKMTSQNILFLCDLKALDTPMASQKVKAKGKEKIK